MSRVEPQRGPLKVRQLLGGTWPAATMFGRYGHSPANSGPGRLVDDPDEFLGQARPRSRVDHGSWNRVLCAAVDLSGHVGADLDLWAGRRPRDDRDPAELAFRRPAARGAEALVGSVAHPGRRAARQAGTRSPGQLADRAVDPHHRYRLPDPGAHRFLVDTSKPTHP